MNYLYVLKNTKTGKFYTGSTSDLKRRLRDHKSGQTRTTRILKTFTLVYKESFDTLEKARLREKQIKKYKSKKYIEKLIAKIN